MTRALRPAAALATLSLVFAAGACQQRAVAPNAQRVTRTEVRELSPPPGALALPRTDGSVRFAVIGDSGRGDQTQHEVARQMVAWREKFPFDFVIMLGDNIYPPHGPDDYVTKFEQPYRALLDAGVTFYAAIGNHDPDAELAYGKFNMEGRRYYTFRKNERRLGGLVGAGVRFFVLDSRALDPAQLAWLEDELRKSQTDWKICYFHHPLYTSGRYTIGARVLRLALEPILIDGDVDVVLSGHEHFYERLRPQHGISYFISGGAGSLRKGDIRRPSPLMARGFDTDFHFMMMEVSGDTLYFQAIARTGETIDAGSITRMPVPKTRNLNLEPGTY
jgi:calcineurin-like phosphoesterase family protein